ncbi:MAG: type II secretion system protein [Terrimicrobiaceae bacterium]|nr:type II secretion system protein [Terrimicrobiaceae bacterium]
MRFNRDRRAFTLLEVLMAVGIFAFAGLGLMLALESTLDGARATQREAEVRNGLANRLARLSVGPLRPVKNEDVENGVKYVIEADREEVTNTDRTLLRGFWRIRATAQWTSPGGPQTWTVSHLVYRSDG